MANVFHGFFDSGSSFSNNINADGQKKKSTATSPYLYHIPCLLMQVLLDLWIFKILASLLGVFHLIIQQIKTARSPCPRVKSKEVHKYGHDIHFSSLFKHNSKMHVASLKPQPTLKLKLAAIWGEIISDRAPYSGASARVLLKELHRSSQV